MANQINTSLGQLVNLIDLTNLNDNSSQEDIVTLCNKAATPIGNVAGVCVYPNFIPLTLKMLKNSGIKLISVANFPTGQEKLSTALNEIEYAVSEGADEIDLVFPYLLYQEGSEKEALNYIRTCRSKFDSIILKVILEISAFPIFDNIYNLSTLLINEGVDFLKTSTGRSQHGATIEGASQMLLAIKNNNCRVGFKASGGIKTIEEANAYSALAEDIMGAQWLDSTHFRIGASTLLDTILMTSEELKLD